MKYLMLDTCVWWNLSTDHKEKTILTILDRLIKEDRIRLIVPDIVKDEIHRNREKIINELALTYKSYSKHAKQLGKIFGVDNSEYVKTIDEIDAKIENIPNEIVTNLTIVNSIFNHKNTIPININDEVKNRVIIRGITKKAPFLKSKNSTADAIIAEEFRVTSSNLFSLDASWIAFVTNNKSDFSDPRNPTRSHPDLQDCLGFDPRIEYSINIADLINKIQSGAISNEVVEHVARYPGYRELFCDSGGNHEFIDVGWIPAPYGGRTWHMKCEKCGLLYDTGEYFD